MSAKLPIFIFGSQGPANFVEPLLSLLKHAPGDAHLTAFFQLALDAIRNEVIEIKDAAELSVLPDISKFASFTTLAKWHESNGYQNATVNGIILVVTQVAQVVKAVTAIPAARSAVFDPKAQFIGFCTGAITAAALSVKTSSGWDIIRQGVEAIRLVFFISFRSHQVAEKVLKESHLSDEETLPWSYVLSGIGFEDATKLVAEFNETLVSLLGTVSLHVSLT